MTHQPAVFNRTYDEAFALVVEARNYMRYVEPRTRRRSGEGGLERSCEALRATSRLTQVMAWLMLQRAVMAGEVTQEQAMAEDNLLSGQEVCLVEKDGLDLPPGLHSLLERSHRLYQRVSRLERMVLARLQGGSLMVH